AVRAHGSVGGEGDVADAGVARECDGGVVECAASVGTVASEGVTVIAAVLGNGIEIDLATGIDGEGGVGAKGVGMAPTEDAGVDGDAAEDGVGTAGDK